MLRWNIHAAHTALQASTHLSDLCPSSPTAKYMGPSKKCIMFIEIIESCHFYWFSNDIPGMDVGWCGIMFTNGCTFNLYMMKTFVCRLAHLCNQRPCFPKTSSHEKFKGPPERLRLWDVTLLMVQKSSKHLMTWTIYDLVSNSYCMVSFFFVTAKVSR